MLRCEECGAESETGEDWRAYLTVDDETVTYCPECAEREFNPEPA
jgi:NAD-dependent SIR2 family protein deacetylase